LDDCLEELKTKDFKIITSIALKIAFLLKNLHVRNLTHRNLDGRSIILTVDHYWMLANLDLDRVLTLIRAPELYNPKVKPSHKSDIFNFGFILYELLKRKVPWAKKPKHKIKENITTGIRPRIQFGNNNSLYEVYIKLLKECWGQDIEKRPSIHTVIDSLERIKGMSEMDIKYSSFRN